MEVCLLLLVGNNLLNANSRLNSHSDGVVAISPGVSDFLSESLGELWKVEIGLFVTTFVHEGETAIFLNVGNGPLRTVDDWDGSSVGRGDHIFVLLSGENIGSREIALGVAVLSCLGDGDAQNLARLSLNHHETANIDIIEEQTVSDE
jgi:hypothetical protein